MAAPHFLRTFNVSLFVPLPYFIRGRFANFSTRRNKSLHAQGHLSFSGKNGLLFCCFFSSISLSVCLKLTVWNVVVLARSSISRSHLDCLRLPSISGKIATCTSTYSVILALKLHHNMQQECILYERFFKAEKSIRPRHEFLVSYLWRASKASETLSETQEILLFCRVFKHAESQHPFEIHQQLIII